ncbi:NTF2 fold immunity protein [Pedobacter cryoconitis]|uniref:NTF2 fold immunity protein of polymorphic toxin system component n=1 Tax=Pedobacter cryoconitis TaxID=188932 RepID=A0A327S2Z0_9SPHI|nr:NTF2 fold immunity protein [Pedobacter cryoconitis]RAJ23118.1 NTF2 fold immunity protein of polymorphic toxin system component [Pedobacter cryoconitis]
MDLEKYTFDSIADAERTAEKTVTEFVIVYNRWAKECHNMVVADREKLNELTQKNSIARQTLQEIYKKYCTSKNRQYHRNGTGYYFYGGTYMAGTAIESCTELSKNEVMVQTEKVKNFSPVKRYLVVKKGQIWKIDGVESLNGNKVWEFDIL